MGYLFKSRSQEAAENCCVKLQDSKLHWTIIIIVVSARPGPTGLYKVCLDNTAGHKTAAAAAAAASPHQPSLHVCSNAVCRNGGTRSLKRRRRVQKPYGGGGKPQLRPEEKSLAMATSCYINGSNSPHTDHSIVFAVLLQCASHLRHGSLGQRQSNVQRDRRLLDRQTHTHTHTQTTLRGDEQFCLLLIS